MEIAVLVFFAAIAAGMIFLVGLAWLVFRVLRGKKKGGDTPKQ